MNIHKNARSAPPLRREEMARSVSEGRLSKAEAAQVYGVSAKIVARWIERYQCDGRAGMADRSSRPGRMPRQTGRIVVERTAVSAASTRSFRRCYGSCYRSKAFARACRHLSLKHLRKTLSLKSKTPISRLGLTEDNLLRLHI